MQTVSVIREFFAIRFSHAEFGARPDLTDPTMVDHPLSDGRYVVRECESMTAAYKAAHAAIGDSFADGPLKGRSVVNGNVEVLRVAEHPPTPIRHDDSVWDELIGPKTVTMTITGVDVVRGIPHWACAPLSRYHPLNGWDVPTTIDV